MKGSGEDSCEPRYKRGSVGSFFLLFFLEIIMDIYISKARNVQRKKRFVDWVLGREVGRRIFEMLFIL
jgi:hypothetical protein